MIVLERAGIDAVVQVAVFGIFVFQNQVCMGTMPNFVVEDDCRRIYRKIHCGQPGYIR